MWEGQPTVWHWMGLCPIIQDAAAQVVLDLEGTLKGNHTDLDRARALQVIAQGRLMVLRRDRLFPEKSYIAIGRKTQVRVTSELLDSIETNMLAALNTARMYKTIAARMTGPERRESQDMDTDLLTMVRPDGEFGRAQPDKPMLVTTGRVEAGAECATITATPGGQPNYACGPVPLPPPHVVKSNPNTILTLADCWCARP